MLAVLAHPDDESFGMGGTLALYARRGVKVYLVCATRGEAGDVDEQYLRGYASIAERRETELRCAAGHLGLAGVYFLNYRDSGMPGSADNNHERALAAAPVDRVAEKVAGYIRRLRPQVVLTFDSIGGYRHPDHIAVHNATVKAFKLAGGTAFMDEFPPYQPQKLYFSVIPMRFARIIIKALTWLGVDFKHFGRNKDIDVTAIVADADFPVHARIAHGEVASQREKAVACHASQLDGSGMSRGPMRWLQYLFGRRDYFMRAYPPAGEGLKERDLFEGIIPENGGSQG